VSPRPRKASDEEVFAAAGRVMARLGPAQLTLSDLAAEAGLTAGALVQRFGSKRGLLLALSGRAAAQTGETFEGLRAAHRSPLAALRAYGDCMAQMGETPGTLANFLAWLQLDLTDADFHRNVLAQARATRAALRALIEDAVAAGELASDADPDRLARGVEVTLSGSLMTWAFYQDRPAAIWVREDLESLLAPWLARDPRGGVRHGRKRPRGARLRRG
jgi:AcrR family transcriptional regulator